MSSSAATTSEDQYQKTLTQIEAISDEIKSTQQLTSEVQPMSNLLEFYQTDDSDSCSNEANNFIE